jgi:hypothetical protein
MILKAAGFQLRLSGFLKKTERFLVRLKTSGDKTVNLACASVAGAEQMASERHVGEVWYQIELSDASKELESIQEMFAVIFLSSRTQSFSIAFSGEHTSQYDDLGFSSATDFEVPRDSGSMAYLSDARASSVLGAILTKPFYQSEIAPNDYLKRVSNGRMFVLMSVSDPGFKDCWRQILYDMQALFGDDAGALFIIVDRTLIPQEEELPPGLIVQSLETLGFTGLERLALARNVDFVVTDYAPYALSAFSKGTTILVPEVSEEVADATAFARTVEFQRCNVAGNAT